MITHGRTHDGERFVIRFGQLPGSYVKFVLTVNESYALEADLRRFREERQQEAVMNAAEHGALSV